MNALYRLCRAEGQGIFSTVEILKAIPYGVDFRESDLDPTMEALSLDGYFSYEPATRKGEDVYCIVLREKGVGYERAKKKTRGKIALRIAITVALAVLSYFVKVIVDLIVTG